MRHSLYLGRAGGQSWMGDGAWVRHLLDHIEQRCCDRMSRAFALREDLRHAAVLQCTAPCKQIVPRTMSRGRGHASLWMGARVFRPYGAPNERTRNACRRRRCVS